VEYQWQLVNAHLTTILLQLHRVVNPTTLQEVPLLAYILSSTICWVTGVGETSVYQLCVISEGNKKKEKTKVALTSLCGVVTF